MFRALRGGPAPSNEPFVRPSPDQIRRLLDCLAPCRGRLIIPLITLTLGSAMGLVFPWIMQMLVDAAPVGQDVGRLNSITLWLMAAFLARSVFSYLSTVHNVSRIAVLEAG